MAADLPHVFDALEQLDADPRWNDEESIRARCPASEHGGNRDIDNLSIRANGDGRLSAKCFSHSCGQQGIWKAIRAEMPTRTRSKAETNGDAEFERLERWARVGEAARYPRPFQFSEPINDYFEAHAIDPVMAASLGVREEDGTLIYPPNGRWRPPDGKTRQPKGKPLELWWGAEPDGDHPVLICEGESDLLAAVSVGTKPGVGIAAIPGVGFPVKRLAEDLSKRGVTTALLAFDADTAGQRYATKVEAELSNRGLTVRRLELPAGSDLAETLASSDDRSERLSALMDPKNGPPQDGATATPFSEIEPLDVDFLLPGVPEGMLAMLAGHTDVGKSNETTRWTAQVTEGGLSREPGNVLFAYGEDDPGITRDRLDAAGADLSRVFLAELWRKGQEHGFKIPDDLPEIESLLIERECRLFVIDPINNFFRAGLDSHRDTDSRQVFTPLTAMAKRTGVAVVLVTHLNKQSGGLAVHRLGGSVAYGAAPRSVFLLDHNPDDPDGERGLERVLAHEVCNVGPKEGSKLLRLCPTEIGGRSTVRMELLGDSELTARELLDQNAEHSGSSKVEDAENAISRLLERHGEMASAEVKELLEDAGFSERTIQRASKSLGLKVRLEGSPPESYWKLNLFRKRADK